MSALESFIIQCNEFIGLTLKFKDSITIPHLKQIKQRAKLLGLPLQDANEVDTRKFILSKEFFALLKSKMHVQLNRMINCQPQTT